MLPSSLCRYFARGLRRELLLAIPDLVALGIPDMVAAAGYPSTPKIPAVSYVLSLLALKLTSTRRVSHVYDIAADPPCPPAPGNP